MKHQSILPICVFLLLLSFPHPSHSHNGAVAIAVPVEGITVDGDFSDWPEGMREYLIESAGFEESFVPPNNSLDFQGSFRIGFNEEENALYIALEVQDESQVITEGNFYYLDGCEIYLDVMHMKGIPSNLQLGLWGKKRAGVGSEGKWEYVSLEIQRKDTHSIMSGESV